MSILDEAVAKFDALKMRLHDLIEPEKTLGEALESVVKHAVDEIHALEQRIIALENHPAVSVPPLYPIQNQIPEPAVGENTGSGASPSAPSGDEASAGAASTPAAEGTADTDAEQSGA